jgi:hypothetical protein
MNVLLSKLLAQTVNTTFMTVNPRITGRQTGDWNITAATPSARSQQHKYDDLARIQVKKRAVPWLRRLAAGLSQRRPLLNPRPVHVQFEGDNVALQQRFSPNTLCFKSRSGLIGIAPILRAGRSGAESRRNKRIFSTPAQWCTHPPIQLVARFLPGKKVAGACS